MGLRHVWLFVLAPSGRSGQTHAWGCCRAACVGTGPCTWLHRTSLFWHANSFGLPCCLLGCDNRHFRCFFGFCDHQHLRQLPFPPMGRGALESRAQMLLPPPRPAPAGQRTSAWCGCQNAIFLIFESGDCLCVCVCVRVRACVRGVCVVAWNGIGPRDGRFTFSAVSREIVSAVSREIR